MRIPGRPSADRPIRLAAAAGAVHNHPPRMESTPAEYADYRCVVVVPGGPMCESRTEVDTARLDRVGPVEYLIVEFTSGRAPPDTAALQAPADRVLPG
jgi:hypothetical protein